MSRLKFLSLTLVTVFLSACGAEAEAPSTVKQMTEMPVSTNALADSEGEYWKVLSEQSYLKFSAEQEGKSFTGEFKRFDAKIIFNPDDLNASSVKVTVPLKQVDAGSKDRNASLPSADWFSVKKFPKAIYISTNFSKTGENEYLATGTLSIKGIEKPLNLPFTLDVTNGQAVMRSQLLVDRTRWNIGSEPWNTDEWVSKAVLLDILITAEKG